MIGILRTHAGELPRYFPFNAAEGGRCAYCGSWRRATAHCANCGAGEAGHDMLEGHILTSWATPDVLRFCERMERNAQPPGARTVS